MTPRSGKSVYACVLVRVCVCVCVSVCVCTCIHVAVNMCCEPVIHMMCALLPVECSCPCRSATSSLSSPTKVFSTMNWKPGVFCAYVCTCVCAYVRTCICACVQVCLLTQYTCTMYLCVRTYVCVYCVLCI